MKKQFFSILLCLCMVLMLFPVTALAEDPEQITYINAIIKAPIVGEKTTNGWEHISNPPHAIRTSANWYQILKSDYTEGADNNWEYIGFGRTYSEDYYYKVVFSAEVEDSSEKTYIIPDTVDANINGQKCDIQVADDHKSCLLSYVFEAQVPQTISSIDSIDITFDEPVLGKTPNLKPEFTASPKDSIQRVLGIWAKLPKGSDPMNGSWEFMKDGEVFTEGYYYGFGMSFNAKDGFSFNEETLFTVNGEKIESPWVSVKPESAGITVIFNPLEPQDTVTLTVPFTTTVKLGGNAAPGETTFKLELVNERGGKLSFDDVEITATVTTNGEGSYKGTMTFTGSLENLYRMLGQGAFVKQVDERKANWTYDDTVWGLVLEENTTALLSLEDEPEYILKIYPTGFEEDGDGGRYYYLDPNANPVERMSFTNTYTYSAPVHDTTTIVIGGEKEENKPVEENPNTGAPVAASLSTISVLVLASAVAVLKTRKH